LEHSLNIQLVPSISKQRAKLPQVRVTTQTIILYDPVYCALKLAALAQLRDMTHDFTPAAQVKKYCCALDGQAQSRVSQNFWTRPGPTKSAGNAQLDRSGTVVC
jgi:hypothetical protein